MLWEKLRRDAFIKKLIGSNQNQLFGIQYIDDNNNNNNNNNNNQQNNDLPVKTSEEQVKNSQQIPQNTYTAEENIEVEDKPNEPTNEQPLQEEQKNEEQTFSQNSDNNNNDNDYNDNQSQESIVQNNKPNEKEEILKNYLQYLNKKEDSPQEQQNIDTHRDSREYDMGSPATNSRVPDIIRGYMSEAPTATNAHTFGMKIPKIKSPEYTSEEPMHSQSQVSPQFQSLDGRPVNQNFMQTFRFPQNEDMDTNLRLVGSGMSFGHRSTLKDTEPLKFGYGFKSYPEYNEEKAKRFRAKSKLLAQPIFKDKPTLEEEVVLVTADPNQREIIETLEAQNSRRNHRKFSNDWTGTGGSTGKNAIDYQLDKDFNIDASRIEYNGWRP